MADEVRMIDAELLRTNIAQIAKNCARSDAQKALIGRILFMIENMPTADIEPVKHGRWEVNGDRFYQFCPFCSNCKYEPPKELIRCNALSLEPILTKYCPNCGFENGTKIYKGGDKDNNMRNLTDEETVIYESWIENEAKDTGVNIMDGDSE